MLSKVLQNLANDTLPGEKQTWMENLNSFITSNKPTITGFYASIVSDPERGKDFSLAVPDYARADALLTLHEYIGRHHEAIVQAYLDDGGEQGVVEELESALEALGDPSSAGAADQGGGGGGGDV